jgi:RNA polymerase sigma-70 factor (ECF subfamily)
MSALPGGRSRSAPVPGAPGPEVGSSVRPGAVRSGGGAPLGGAPPPPPPASSPASGNPDAAQDAALAARACSDPEAFGQLYDRYCDPVYRFAYRRLGDRQAAEDATAEVFFKALRAINSYKPEVAPFSAWLYRIAANALTDVLRARRPVESLDTAMDRPDAALAVDAQAINRLEVGRVWSAVDQLTAAQRMAVILRLGHDLPIAEVAARMDRSEGAVKLLLNRGLTTVRRLLSVEGVTAREGGSR